MEVKAEVSRQHGRAPSERRKILYIQPGTHSFAGIEHVVDTICSNLAEKFADEFEVDVLYTTVHSNRPTGLRKYNSIDRLPRSRIELMRTFRQVIKSKDYSLVVVPQIEPAVICMASCLGLRRNFAVHLHGNPRLERSHVKAKILFFLMRAYFLRRASYVFGTSPRQLESFRSMFGSGTPDSWVPNPVRRFDPGACAKDGVGDHVTFVNVGRFSYQKGQDILLRAFGDLFAGRKNARLKIVGYGEGEAGLRRQIERLGLTEVVRIEHYPDNPQPALAASDVYVSTSRWEGWSLAICEALRFGLPVIATDCEFGPSDILVDDRLGRLVPIDDVGALVHAMAYYCDNLTAQTEEARFRQEFIDRYSPEKVVDIHARAVRAAAR